MSLLLILLAQAAPAVQEAPAPGPPAAPKVLVYDRKPLRPPLSCRAAELEAANVHCSEEEPCRIFLELVAVEAVGPKILVTGNLHTSSATVSSIAFLSDDAGSTWREPMPRVAGAGFESIQFLSDLQAWIAVQPHGQFPHDPYLLATSNGGQSWEPLRIWPEEGRLGLLQQFHFNSREQGFAIIDRSSAGYEMYETPNAGASWMLRETSPRAIAPKWPARKPSDWRLREDAKLRTYEVERRLGGAWQRVANFSVEIGVCKNPEPAAAPAPVSPPQNP
jgi:hypothetical protein